MSNEKCTEDLKYMKNYSFLMNYDLNKNMKKVSMIYKIFGFDITRKILAIYLKKLYGIKSDE